MAVEQKVISIQEKLKDLAFEEIGEIFNFSSVYYGVYLLGLVNDFIETEQIPEEIASALVPHLISWVVFSHRLSDEKKSIFEFYLDSPKYKSRMKPKVHTLISEWKYALPGVYNIEGFLGERVLVLKDIILMKERLVGVYNEIYHLPKESDLLIGYLLPAGDSTYFPIIDFFHIPAVHKKQAAYRIIEFYNKAETTDHEFFVRYYPKLLSIISSVIK
ncbi:hypothetical protein [Mesobacillus selenatarsenatis]|uniref:Uncharacterized protein n=1 Tax=Mesobacillus selenatarsenatis (strain DSM 18680 / JCM 14380 / FERM P-15431 / SF-1) TaxID=1321606 RepID=A0A0A8X4Q3_MESS1|nr:hypothetical protein [Mesobacillus selenatarsenatis]GAM14017.1 hypothetical protein SAMD00020551_2164 [Mesobacillus selenatarsenatis SF-1]